MQRFFTLAAIGILALQARSGLSQTKETEADADARKFQALVTKLAAQLRATPAFALEIASHWKIDSEDKSRLQDGRNRFKLIREQGNRLRIEANPGDQLQPTVIVACDGKQLITYLRPNGIFERTTTADAAGQVLHSQFLTTSLQGTGIDILLMPDWPSHLEKSISRLDYTGPSKVDGEELEHFQMNLGKDEVEMWFHPGPGASLIQYRRTVTVPLEERTSVKVITTAKLKWTLARSFPPATFQVDLPAVARKVPSVYEALVKGEKAEILGKQAPSLTLRMLDGKPLDLTTHRGRKEVIVLLYFATWSAPSAEGLAALTKAVEEHRRKGVAFYGVNVGESKEDVMRFVAVHKIDMPVALDPRGDSTDDFLINSLPAAIMIGKDGTVQSVLQGDELGKDGLAKITRSLDRLLKGESLIVPER